MSLDLTKPDPTAPAPRRSEARLRRRSRSVVARSAGGDRWLVALIGLVLLAVGVGVALLSYGVFDSARAGRPLLDPIMVDTVSANLLLARMIAIAGGIVLVVLGLAWVARSVRPEPRPDLLLSAGPDTTILVSSGAAADAVAAQAGNLPGVGRPRARLVGSTAAPALRVTLWPSDDADVHAVVQRLHNEVMATARSALDLPALPVAVRLEVERSRPGSPEGPLPAPDPGPTGHLVICFCPPARARAPAGKFQLRARSDAGSASFRPPRVHPCMDGADPPSARSAPTASGRRVRWSGQTGT